LRQVLFQNLELGKDLAPRSFREVCGAAQKMNSIDHWNIGLLKKLLFIAWHHKLFSSKSKDA
jgi:hypothetical protein